MGFGDGISLAGGEDNVVRDNQVNDSARFAMFVESDANRMLRNAIRNSPVGIRISDGTENEVVENVIRRCGSGIQLASPENRAWGNEVSKYERGIVLFEDANDSEVRWNRLSKGGEGIALIGVRDSWIDANQVTKSEVGILLFDESARNEVTHNHLDKNVTGVLFEQSVSLTFLGFNRVSRSVLSGFFVNESGGNTFEGNESLTNGSFGFEDVSQGSGTMGTGNFYLDNVCEDNKLGGSSPAGLCEGNDRERGSPPPPIVRPSPPLALQVPAEAPRGGRAVEWRGPRSAKDSARPSW